MDGSDRRNWLGSMLATLLAFLVPACVAPSKALAADRLDEIIKIWKERQQRVRTVHFEWTESRTYGKNSLPSMRLPGPGGGPVAKPGPTPPEVVTHEDKQTLSLDGDSMRYSSDGPQWSANHERFFNKSYVSVFDGKDSKNYFSNPKDGERPDPDTEYKSGYVDKEMRNQDVTNYSVWPILLTYRPLHPVMGRIVPREWAVAGQEGVIQGKKCIVIEKRESDSTETCWVDMSQEASILRYDRSVQGGWFISLKITYRADPSSGFVPSGWKITTLKPGGKFDKGGLTTVKRSEINLSLPPETFQFSFPPGTLVQDYKNDVKYIELEDGGRRIITPEELARVGGRYQEFLATESGMAGVPPRPGWKRFLLTAIVVGAIIFLAGLAVWRKRVKGRGSSSARSTTT